MKITALAHMAAIHDRVLATCARILLLLSDKDYGDHDFTFRDPEGHIWSVVSHTPCKPGDAVSPN